MSTSRKIVILVAPVRHLDMSISPGVRNPVAPEAIAEEVVGCARFGASMVHLHVRDEQGRPTADLGPFRRTLDGILSHSDIIIQGSTGGLSTLTLDERCVSLDERRVEVASLNMGSVNFIGESVYINTLPDIRYWARRMLKRNIRPELEIFDLSMVASVRKLAREGLLPEPLYFSFCLGFEGALEATPENLFHLRAALPPGAVWGLTHDDMSDLTLVAAALGSGATVLRVGFEDSFSYRAGALAATNVDLVRRVADLVGACGHDVATPAEARALLGITRPPEVAP